MTTYRTGNHWGVTIVREGDGPQPCSDTGRHYCVALGEDAQHSGDELVAVVTNGDRELAERICALLNGESDDPEAGACVGACVGICAGCTPDCHLVGDSCSCSFLPGGTDPNCVVHQGRRAKGPKPPSLGPGCVCDGSGRPCPRHGVVL